MGNFSKKEEQEKTIESKEPIKGRKITESGLTMHETRVRSNEVDDKDKQSKNCGIVTESYKIRNETEI